MENISVGRVAFLQHRLYWALQGTRWKSEIAVQGESPATDNLTILWESMILAQESEPPALWRWGHGWSDEETQRQIERLVNFYWSQDPQISEKLRTYADGAMFSLWVELTLLQREVMIVNDAAKAAGFGLVAAITVGLWEPSPIEGVETVWTLESVVSQPPPAHDILQRIYHDSIPYDESTLKEVVDEFLKKLCRHLQRTYTAWLIALDGLVCKTLARAGWTPRAIRRFQVEQLRGRDNDPPMVQVNAGSDPTTGSKHAPAILPRSQAISIAGVSFELTRAGVLSHGGKECKLTPQQRGIAQKLSGRDEVPFAELMEGTPNSPIYGERFAGQSVQRHTISVAIQRFKDAIRKVQAQPPSISVDKDTLIISVTK